MSDPVVVASPPAEEAPPSAEDEKIKADEKLARQIARDHNRLAEALREWQKDEAAIARTAEFTFNQADIDKSGAVEKDEVNKLIADIFLKSGVVTPPSQEIIDKCWQSMDANKDGKVTIAEWTNFLRTLSKSMVIPEDKPMPRSRGFMMQGGMQMQGGMGMQQRPMGMGMQQRPMGMGMNQGMMGGGMGMQQGMMQNQMAMQNMQHQQQMQSMQMQNQMQMNNMMMMKAMGSSSWSSSDYFRRRGCYRPRNHRRYNRPGMMWHGHGGRGHGHGHGHGGGGLSVGFGISF